MITAFTVKAKVFGVTFSFLLKTYSEAMPVSSAEVVLLFLQINILGPPNQFGKLLVGALTFSKLFTAFMFSCWQDQCAVDRDLGTDVYELDLSAPLLPQCPQRAMAIGSSIL